MKRFDETRPLRVAYVIGTFSAAPLTLACMAEFLDWVQRPETQQKYALATARTDAWVHSVNKVLAAEDLPMRVDNLTTVWTVLFTRPGRYHWMFQYYLRAEGLSFLDARRATACLRREAPFLDARRGKTTTDAARRPWSISSKPASTATSGIASPRPAKASA